MLYRVLLGLGLPLIILYTVSDAVAVSKASVRKSSEVTDSDLLKRLFHQAPHIYPPTGKTNRQKIMKWRNIFSERDLDFDKKLIKYRNNKGMELITTYQHLLSGWHSMLEAGHLKMIYGKCNDNDIPFEIVFLALAESAWDPLALSHAGAKGYWQFMPATAKSYGLIDDDIDYRSHAQRSTEAAIRLLKDNYKLTLAWDRVYKINGAKVTNSDRWLWAFWAYNRSPKSVAKYYKQFRGDPKPFADGVDNNESANYVSKIFAIREVLKEYVVNSQVVISGTKGAKTAKKSQADKEYAQYKKTWYSQDLPQRLESLEQIRRMYLAEGVVSKKGTSSDIPNVVQREIWYIKEVLAEINYRYDDGRVVESSDSNRNL
ncbi:MAG: transglycosylase SLT domain-containing protein [Candidatus Magnetobacterium sp. LHC-1]|uniref:Transglycosylase SLT domain-containing protein n=1 Tax=Candidatus Magnetobacterium casense TaxID=1455061 RepID=A0ABS6RX51_9BACT|nr:transglycosylase SLT domain-containing protein [Candidatus Magnetobacterium casensis]MBF0606387.1 transglycosylase SLT domain-containing protein [Nitrospirota bacterium]MBV6341203.1 transglycosylase SLT domain-containing protein [Candidatus Magnetobacterium casensis]